MNIFFGSMIIALSTIIFNPLLAGDISTKTDTVFENDYYHVGPHDLKEDDEEELTQTEESDDDKEEAEKRDTIEAKNGQLKRVIDDSFGTIKICYAYTLMPTFSTIVKCGRGAQASQVGYISHDSDRKLSAERVQSSSFHGKQKVSS